MSDERKQAARTRVINALANASAEMVERAAHLLESEAAAEDYDPVADGKARAAREIARGERAKDALR